MKMHALFKRIATTAPILGAVSTIAVIINLAVLVPLFPKVVAFEPLPSWTDPVINGLVGPCFLLIALYHVTALITLGWQINALQSTNLLRPLLVAFGVVSLLLVAANFPLLGDIGNEYEAGLETEREWHWVFFNHGVHLVFSILGSWCMAYTNRVLATGGTMETAARDEAVFLSAHYIGVFSGALGLTVLSVLLFTDFPTRFFGRAVGMFGTITITPYILAVASWLILKRGQALREWIDEKQFLDVTKAAFTTVLVLFPLLAIGYANQRDLLPDVVIRDAWFPTAGFLGLLIFSLSAVWFARRA